MHGMGCRLVKFDVVEEELVRDPKTRLCIGAEVMEVETRYKRWLLFKHRLLNVLTIQDTTS